MKSLEHIQKVAINGTKKSEIVLGEIEPELLESIDIQDYSDKEKVLLSLLASSALYKKSGYTPLRIDIDLPFINFEKKENLAHKKHEQILSELVTDHWSDNFDYIFLIPEFKDKLNNSNKSLTPLIDSFFNGWSISLEENSEHPTPNLFYTQTHINNFETVKDNLKDLSCLTIDKAFNSIKFMAFKYNSNFNLNSSISIVNFLIYSIDKLNINYFQVNEVERICQKLHPLVCENFKIDINNISNYNSKFFLDKMINILRLRYRMYKAFET